MVSLVQANYLCIHIFLSFSNKRWAPWEHSLSRSSLHSLRNVIQSCRSNTILNKYLCKWSNCIDVSEAIQGSYSSLFLFSNLFCPSPWLHQASWCFIILPRAYCIPFIIIYQFIQSKDRHKCLPCLTGHLWCSSHSLISGTMPAAKLAAHHAVPFLWEEKEWDSHPAV